MTAPRYLTYEFGPFQLDTVKRLLTKNGEAVALTPKALDILIALIEEPGKTIDKELLIRKVWRDCIVEEGNLTFNIHKLRRALGEGPKEHNYILTIPGRGYRFVANVRELLREPEPRGLDVPAQRNGKLGASATSLAVLPFRSSDNIDEGGYLGLSLADALITRLGHLKQIVVRPTSAVRRYATEEKDPGTAGFELGVEAVLEGSIRRSNDKIRVTVQLISVRDGSAIWADKFDEKFTDVFAVEDRVSQRVASALELELSGEEQHRLARRNTTSSEAHHAYLKGTYYWDQRTEEGVRKAIEQYELAISNDPTFALAYAGLADCYSLLSFYGIVTPREAFPRAKAAAMRALEIDESLAEAHASLAYVHLYYDWDWKAAEAEFKRSIELKANYATAHHWYHEYLTLVGRFQEATVEIKRAQELDPLSPAINAAMVLPLLHAGEYEKGIRGLQRVIALDPDFYRTHLFLGTAYVSAGEFEKAFVELRQAVDLSHRNHRTLAVLGWALGRVGDRSGAEAIISELEAMTEDHYVPAYAFAMVYAATGLTDRAFESLERAFEERDEWLTRLKIAREMDPLRKDPRFDDLLRRMGFPTDR